MKGFKGRALFNLLRLKYKDKELPPSLDRWQVEDYRNVPTDGLLERIKGLGVHLDLEGLKLYASHIETPEQLLYHLMPKQCSEKEKLHLYLLLFELWRRYVVDKPSLSIFADDLDHTMEQFFRYELEDEQATKQLLILEDILDNSVDEGNPPQSVFVAISTYLAHDLQLFIYEFIKKQIEESKLTYASELIDAFYAYMPNQTAFDLLRVKIVADSDIQEANVIAERLAEKILVEKQKLLAFELLQFLAKEGKPGLFYKTFQQVVPLIETEKEFKKMLEIAAVYYRGFDKEIEEKEILKLLEARKNIDPNDKVQIKDMILKAFHEQESVSEPDSI